MSSDTQVDFYTTPAGTPPPGVVPNLVNPFSLHTIGLVTHVLCLSVSTIALALPVFTKAHIMKQFQVEDCNQHLSYYPRPLNANLFQIHW